MKYADGLSDAKVDKQEGWSLITDEERQKLESVESGANKTITEDTFSKTSINPLTNGAVTKRFEADESVTADLAKNLQTAYNKLKDKTDNTAEGAAELLDNLIESETTPGNEDYLIIKSLKQYTLRPFTSLWNWIKSNLAKVATSGSYNDLTNKPDIPTVDSSFSESGTNAVAGNTILAALNSKANKTELQALSNQVSNKADADHTHNYAGSSTVGGSATTANALTSKNIGSDTQPVYFNSTGTPSPIKYTLGDASTKTIKTATAVSSAAWVNLATGQKYIPDMAFLSYWNGAVNDQGGSNLKYCNKGAFGTAATKGVDTDVTSNSANLVTSGGVAAALANYVKKTDVTAQTVLYTSTTNTTSATITGLFANYSLVWFQVVGSKTTHTHILPLKYLKSKGSLTFKDSGTPINILYVSDTQIRWFEYQGQGTETYTSVTIVKII